MDHEDITKSLNRQAAELTILRLLLNATIRQVPDLRLLRFNFNQMAEDTEVRAIYSARSEAFFEEFRGQRALWMELLDDVIMSREDAPPSGS